MNEAGHRYRSRGSAGGRSCGAELGMPMGPLELIDLVGLSVSSHVSENMQKAYGERMEPAPLWISLRMAADSKSGPPKVLIKKRFRPRRLNPTVSAAIADLARRSRTPPKAVYGTKRSCNAWSIRLLTAARCLDEKSWPVPMTSIWPWSSGPVLPPSAAGHCVMPIRSVLPGSSETLDRFSKDHPRFTPCEALAAKRLPANVFTRPRAESANSRRCEMR